MTAEEAFDFLVDRLRRSRAGRLRSDPAWRRDSRYGQALGKYGCSGHVSATRLPGGYQTLSSRACAATESRSQLLHGFKYIVALKIAKGLLDTGTSMWQIRGVARPLQDGDLGANVTLMGDDVEGLPCENVKPAMASRVDDAAASRVYAVLETEAQACRMIMFTPL